MTEKSYDSLSPRLWKVSDNIIPQIIKTLRPSVWETWRYRTAVFQQTNTLNIDSKATVCVCVKERQRERQWDVNLIFVDIALSSNPASCPCPPRARSSGRWQICFVDWCRYSATFPSVHFNVQPDSLSVLLENSGFAAILLCSRALQVTLKDLSLFI